MSAHDHIQQVALERFALRGIDATTIQDIADTAEVSKASVLYHFSSKEQLVDSVLDHALTDLESLVSSLTSTPLDSAEARSEFLDRFVDFLITHRLASHIVVSHPYLAGQIESLRRASTLMAALAEHLSQAGLAEYERLRFGVAVSGATYALVSAGQLGVERVPDDQLRPLLTSVVQDMTGLSPVRERVTR